MKPYNSREASDRLGCPQSTLLEQAREGRIEHLRPFQIGSRWYFPRRLVDALANGEAA